MARMLGRMRSPMCPVCRHGYAPGPDCGDVGKSARQCKRIEARETRREILDWLVQDAAEHNLYELTAEPRDTR